MNRLTAVHSLLTLTLALSCLYLLQERGMPKRQPASVASVPAGSAAGSAGEQAGHQVMVAARDEQPRSGIAEEPALPKDALPLVQAPPQNEYFEMERLRHRDPRYRAVQVESMKWGILGQSPELIARVGHAKAEQIAVIWSESSYLSEPSLESGPRLTALQHMNEVRARDAALVQRVAEKLGGEVAGEFERFLQQMPATLEVDQLRTVLAGSEVALRDDQVDNLLSALAQAKRSLQREFAEEEEIDAAVNPVDKGSVRTMAGRLEWSESQIARTQREVAKLREAAAGYLSTEQMKQYEWMLQRKVRAEQLQLEREKIDARIVATRAQQAERAR